MSGNTMHPGFEMVGISGRRAEFLVAEIARNKLWNKWFGRCMLLIGSCLRNQDFSRIVE
jgi:hypothetical protein